MKYPKTGCQYCERQYSNTNIERHEDSCWANPKNTRQCPSCGEDIKNNSSETCSYSCSNSYFSHTRNKPENYINPQTICFHHHGKKCWVCGENKIVAAHHINGDHSDNRPENLAPLCPTHHQYIHSRYRDEIQPIVDEYIKMFLSQ